MLPGPFQLPAALADLYRAIFAAAAPTLFLQMRRYTKRVND